MNPNVSLHKNVFFLSIFIEFITKEIFVLQAVPLIPTVSSCQTMINCWKLLKTVFSPTITTNLFVKGVFMVSSEVSDSLFKELYWNNEQGTWDDLVTNCFHHRI